MEVFKGISQFFQSGFSRFLLVHAKTPTTFIFLPRIEPMLHAYKNQSIDLQIKRDLYNVLPCYRLKSHIRIYIARKINTIQ